jgi:hypothetical protein
MTHGTRESTRATRAASSAARRRVTGEKKRNRTQNSSGAGPSTVATDRTAGRRARPARNAPGQEGQRR